MPELRVPAGLPGLGGLPAHPGRAQDLADGLGADHDPVLLAQVFDQLGQAPGGERQPGLLRRGPGDPADQLADVGAEPRRSAPAPFWVQSGEPLLVERVDHLPRVLRGRGEHRRRLGGAAALHRGQHDPRPPQPNPIPRRAGDLHQSLRLGRVQLSNEHLRLPCHRPPPATASQLINARPGYNANLLGRGTSRRAASARTAARARSGLNLCQRQPKHLRYVGNSSDHRATHV